MSKYLYSFRFEKSVIEDQLKPIAESENRPLTNLIETILKDYIKRHKRKKKKP